MVYQLNFSLELGPVELGGEWKKYALGIVRLKINTADSIQVVASELLPLHRSRPEPNVRLFWRAARAIQGKTADAPPGIEGPIPALVGGYKAACLNRRRRGRAYGHGESWE